MGQPHRGRPTSAKGELSGPENTRWEFVHKRKQCTGSSPDPVMLRVLAAGRLVSHLPLHSSPA